MFLFLSHLHSSTLLVHATDDNATDDNTTDDNATDDNATDDNDVVIAIQLCHRTYADGRRLMLVE